MTSGQTFNRRRFALPAAGAVGLLVLFWLIPAGRGRNFTVGTWLWEAGEWNALCEGWLILAVTAAMCWWQGKTRVRLSAVRPGHWLWLAGGLVFLLFFVQGMRVGETLFALAMMPPLLVCGICWVCGGKTGMGFAWPLLMLYAFTPVWSDYVRSWSYRFEIVLCEWQQQDVFDRTRPAYEWGLYPYFFLALALCWLPRWCWWKMVLVLLAGMALAAAHVFLFGGMHTC
jgi:hypothetical protein